METQQEEIEDSLVEVRKPFGATHDNSKKSESIKLLPVKMMKKTAEKEKERD